MARQSRKPKLVPQSKHALDQMKYEIAAELALPIEYPAGDMNAEFASELGTPLTGGREGYWGNVSSRDAGTVGGSITAKLIQQAERSLFEL